MLIIGGSLKAKEENILPNVDFILTNRSANLAEISSFSSLNCPRRGATAIKLPESGKVCVLGGCNKLGSHLQSAETYSKDEKCWIEAADCLQIGRSCAMSCVVRGEAYVLGGWDGRNCLSSVENISKQKINPGLISPIKNGCCLPNSKAEHEILILGGWDGKRTVSAIFVYNLCDGSTKVPRQLPYGIECHSTVVWAAKKAALVIGGFDGESVRNTVIQVDLDTLSSHVWESKLLTPRECHCAELLDNRFLVIAGGWDGFQALDSVEICDLNSADLAFRFAPKLLEPRNRACSIIL